MFPELSVKTASVNARTNMLSIDVECWHQIISRKLSGRAAPPLDKCYQMTLSVLTLLKETETKATFFILGDVAETFPDLVREIEKAGHEVGTHGYSHSPLTRLTPDEFRREIRLSLGTLERTIETPVLGFRAPEFSISETTLWALDILVEFGLRYDSSIFPAAGPRYGMDGFPTGVVEILRKNGSLVEVPLSTVRVWGRNVPVAGGSYFRILPASVVKRAIRRVNREGRPFVLYLHPYELGEEPLLCRDLPIEAPPLAAFKTEVRWNVLRGGIRRKLREILTEFNFSTIREVLGDALQP
jgi:polysaccharide deacetylase family protein (PEP-CTERM system associated)